LSKRRTHKAGDNEGHAPTFYLPEKGSTNHLGGITAINLNLNPSNQGEPTARTDKSQPQVRASDFTKSREGPGGIFKREGLITKPLIIRIIDTWDSLTRVYPAR